MPEESLEKVPPHNLEAEKSLLGSVLIEEDSVYKIADEIDPDDFYKLKHQQIYEAMMDLFSNNEQIDVLTLSNRLEEKENLEQTGGKSYLAELSNSVPTAAHIDEYANIVQKKSIIRELLEAAHEISKLSYDEESQDLDELLDVAQERVFSVGKRHLQEDFTDIRTVLDKAFERIDDLHDNQGKLRGIPSGFQKLDDILAGFQSSDLVILAARPSVGKTSLALDFARHAAVEADVPVGMFSLEMSKEQLVDRLLCAQAEVNLWKLRTGNLSDKPESNDFSKIGNAMGILSEAPIYIDDTAGSTAMEIRTKARRLKAEHDLGMIIVDYLQLMEPHKKSGSRNRVQEVKLSHLRDSGSIEQDADVVMFIYRKAADRNYRIEDIPPDERNLAQVHIAKHRNGPTGMVKTFFDESIASFKSLDTQHEGEQIPEESQQEPVKEEDIPV
ncbi:MAG: replicative DNA helicase [Parcubacteria group bacterium QH_9_35_7]|nr:MAG: replicative DNA helicase [Parcubacteria group bacterium QH_9_35_7]